MLAYVNHFISDQGNGCAICGNCDKVLTEDPCKVPPVCPFCGAEFIGDRVNTSIGGSDF